MKPVSSRRAATVTAADVAACAITALALCPGHLVLTLGGLVAVNAAAAVILPAPGVARAGRLAGRMIPRRVKRRLRTTVSLIVREPKGPRPAEGTKRARIRGWRERTYFHLSRAEWDSRVQIGMSLWHRERLAYRLPYPEQWDDLEGQIWPEGEWTAVIEEFWRENERRRGQ